MQFIFQYPDFHGSDGDMLDAGPVAELAVTAERCGWKGFAFTEHPAPTQKWLDDRRPPEPRPVRRARRTSPPSPRS